MTKLLVKTKRGVHIREKSLESAENLDIVAPNKIKSWLALAEASHDATGGTMEDVIENVINEMRGVTFKADKQKLPVTQEEYEELLIQALKKGVPKSKVDALVVIVAAKKPTTEEMVDMFIRDKK